MVYRTDELKYETALTVSAWQFKAGDLEKMKAEFQRPINKPTVMKIVREWDIRLFEQPTVFILPDDACVLGEGQHRVAAAAKKLGADALITCRVVTTDHPGALFVAMSRSKRRVEQIHVFRAAIADGDENATGVKAIAEKHGFTITDGTGPHAIVAVKTITDAYAMDSHALDSALYVIAKIIEERGEEIGWVKSNVIKTMWYVIRNYDVDLNSLARKVSKKSPNAAVPYTVNDLRRNSEEILSLYNSGRREMNRINPNTPKYQDRAWH